MKITIASQKETWYTQQLVKAAKRNDVAIEVKNFLSTHDTQNVGDVVYWRSSSIESSYPNSCQRSILFQNLLEKNTLIINKTLLNTPYITHKSYQQALIKRHLSSVHTIPTYTAHSCEIIEKLIDSNELQYPFIAKPDHGSRGQNIYLIKKKEDISQIQTPQDYIFQNFIPNTGDYRIYVIGGVAVEIIKRVGEKNSHLNNISQGGKAFRVDNQEQREMLSLLATKIATALDLSICGIDIIYDEKQKRYYFLEVNTVAQWQGLQSISSINIADHIIRYFVSIASQSTKKIQLSKKVQQYYQNNVPFLPKEKQFHFYSRLYLWSKKSTWNEEVERYRSWFVWSKENISKSINETYARRDSLSKKLVNHKEYRVSYAQQYPLLGFFNHTLFKALFIYTIFNYDIREEIKSHKLFVQIHEYHKKLLQDNEAIFSLSTHAINFLYLYAFLFSDKFSITDKLITKLFSIAQKGLLKEKTNTILSRNYLLTHCIIGESLFYSQEISSDRNILYEKFIRELENDIRKNYTITTLDQKFEFLVCAKLLHYSSALEEVIFQEAKNSISPHGSYLVDTLNTHHTSFLRKNLTNSEHRNVLYLMAIL